jgi:hypothetical protein
VVAAIADIDPAPYARLELTFRNPDSAVDN